MKDTMYFFCNNHNVLFDNTVLRMFLFHVQPDIVGSLPNVNELWLDGNLLKTLPPVSFTCITLSV